MGNLRILSFRKARAEIYSAEKGKKIIITVSAKINTNELLKGFNFKYINVIRNKNILWITLIKK